MNIKAVIFDMDGVIFEGENFWIDMHKAYGTLKPGLSLAKKYLQADYEYMANIVAGQLWKGKRSNAYEELVKNRIYQPGTKEVFSYLRQKGIRSAIISTGAYDLALRAQRELGIDEIRANKLEIKKGVFTGKVDIQVSEGQKAKAGLELIAIFKTLLQYTAFIGDSDSDIDLARVVSLPIAYNSKSKELNSIARYTLEYGKLKDITNILTQHGEIKSI
jgi:phosphoserine phosphatase